MELVQKTPTQHLAPFPGCQGQGAWYFPESCQKTKVLSWGPTGFSSTTTSCHVSREEWSGSCGEQCTSASHSQPYLGLKCAAPIAPHMACMHWIIHVLRYFLISSQGEVNSIKISVNHPPVVSLIFILTLQMKPKLISFSDFWV